MKNAFTKTIAISLSAAFLATAAPADPIVDGVVSQLAEQGYSRITISRSSTQVTFKTSQNGMDRILVVDRRTGALISDDQGTGLIASTTRLGSARSRTGDAGWGGDNNGAAGGGGGGKGGGDDNKGGGDEGGGGGGDDDDDDDDDD